MASKSKEPQGFTPERFSQELEDLASKAQNDTFTSRFASQIVVYAQIIVLLALLAVYATASQLNLSPVYGSIPSSIYHAQLLTAGCFIGWAGNHALRNTLSVQAKTLLPIVAICIPGLQHLLGTYSQTIGPKIGPLITELVTLFPLSVLTASSVADVWEDAELPKLPSLVADSAPGIASWSILKVLERLVARHLPAVMGRLVLFTRLGLEIALNVAYAAVSPSKYLVYTAFPLFHTFLLNEHLPTFAATGNLVTSLMSDGWLLLERRESVTGYLSVVQSMEQGFRVMRCDHSLLGGEWIDHRGGPVSEPIYGVFAMLEAVRLAEKKKPVADKDAKALVVGLGVGTTPSAFVAHGINTTVVEMDPVVHEFAVKYFDLKENNEPVLQDAVGYTAALAKSAPATYDYIVHDVFTGGAEPVELFTLEFLQGLGTLLKTQGTVAINYAGDLQLPAPRLIYRTIKQVFPSCRAFREMPPDDEAIAKSGTDFTNMVIFCTKTSEPLTFRAATTADFLRSSARQQFLNLNHEIDESKLVQPDETDILQSNATQKLSKWHEKSAMGHWYLMRTAIPSVVWGKVVNGG